jgi:hypothetical protein
MMLILFKFGAPEHLRLFREQGLLYMKSLRYFAEKEANSARNDKFEGTSNIIQPWDVGEFVIEHPLVGKHVVDPSELAGPVSLRLDRDASLNVFCMFAVTEPQESLSHRENLEFGSSFVLVRNTQEFLDRVAKTAKMEGLQVTAGMVKYFDEHKYSGRIGPFLKPSRFGHQREFRLVASPGIPDVRELIIGSIEDITTPVLPLAEIDSIVDFTPASAQAAGL